MEVIKRDGRSVIFDESKINNAILSAFNEYYTNNDDYKNLTDIERATLKVKNENISKEITDEIKDELHLVPKHHVEDIQNIIEKKLKEKGEEEVYKCYHNYRIERTLIRERNSKIMKKVIKRTYATDIENMNANVDERSFSGREKEASGDVQKILALDYTLSKDVSEAHQNMLIYQHDLDKANIGEHNCLNIDFEELFKYGFSTRNGDVRPPKSFASACQLYAVIFQCQSQVQFGGVGSVHIDVDLAPMVKISFKKNFIKGLRYFNNIELNDDYKVSEFEKENGEINLDNKKIKEIYEKVYNFAVDELELEGSQACQGLYHNLNTLESRAGRIGCRL